jgi:hypothetical protein
VTVSSEFHPLVATVSPEIDALPTVTSMAFRRRRVRTARGRRAALREMMHGSIFLPNCDWSYWSFNEHGTSATHVGVSLDSTPGY